jgi:hypothetical protein
MELRMAWFVKELRNGLLVDPIDPNGLPCFATCGYSKRGSALQAILDSNYCSINLVVLENVYRYIV